MSVIDFIDEKGVFADGFVAEAKKVAGEDFKDFRKFDDVRDVDTLVKNYANVETAIGRRLEGIIQKPTEKSTDKEKAVYRETLLKELGAPDKVEDYDLSEMSKDLPEGLKVDEEGNAKWKQFFFEHKWPASIVAETAAFMKQMQIELYNRKVEAEQTAFEDECKRFDVKYRGDNKIKSCRNAYKAIMMFGTDEIKAALKNSKIYETPTDYAKWHSFNVSPVQLDIWSAIGEALADDKVITNEDTKEDTTANDTQRIAKSLFTHPSSVRERENRNKI